MDAKRLYYVLLGSIGLSMVAVLAVVLAATSVLRAESKNLYDAKLDTLVLDEKQGQLSKAKADIEKYKSFAEIAKKIVPQDKDQAQTVREIVAIAAANGIKLGAINFPTSNLGGAKPVGGGGALSQLTPAKDIPGVYNLQITIQSDAKSPASYDQFLNFLDALEHNRRTALVNGISLVPDTANPSRLSFTLNLSEYVKP